MATGGAGMEHPWRRGCDFAGKPTGGAPAAKVPRASAGAKPAGGGDPAVARVDRPLALANLGMPGCTALVSTDVVMLVLGAGAQAAVIQSIPNTMAFFGTTFHQQEFVLDPAAGNALGAVMSEAMTGVVGAR